MGTIIKIATLILIVTLVICCITSFVVVAISGFPREAPQWLWIWLTINIILLIISLAIQNYKILIADVKHYLQSLKGGL